jgi:hypothetical protein
MIPEGAALFAAIAFALFALLWMARPGLFDTLDSLPRRA